MNAAQRIFVFIACLLGVSTIAAEEASERAEVTVRVDGLFSADRVDDFKQVMQKIPEVEVVAVDYETAQGTFRFNPAAAFPGAKPEQYAEHLANRVQNLTRYVFRIRPVTAVPREKLEKLEIRVGGLDCKACSLGAYEAVAYLDGVEQARASFKEGLVVAWIDPAKTNRSALETALKQRGVTLLDEVPEKTE